LSAPRAGLGENSIHLNQSIHLPAYSWLAIPDFSINPGTPYRPGRPVPAELGKKATARSIEKVEASGEDRKKWPAPKSKVD
jgi:hypothetical protein